MIIEVPGMGMQNHNSPDCSVKRGVVFGGSLSFELSFQPLSTFMVSAMGAVAMAAGVRNEGAMVAFGTLGEHHMTVVGTEIPHGL